MPVPEDLSTSTGGLPNSRNERVLGKVVDTWDYSALGVCICLYCISSQCTYMHIQYLYSMYVCVHPPLLKINNSEFSYAEG
uniref:Uncharacterized protein n=1 Tax=Laticauda laticaudata TaxID=8630 RepID=A0A8C5SHD6_LATLA